MLFDQCVKQNTEFVTVTMVVSQISEMTIKKAASVAKNVDLTTISCVGGGRGIGWYEVR